MSSQEPYPIGPFTVSRQRESLTLTIENKCAFTWHILALFAFTMVCVLVLGVLSTFRAAQTGVTDMGDFFYPKKNHFGFLWLFTTVGLLIAGPLVMMRLYKAPLVFTFNARNGTIYRNNELITRFRRVEAICIQERFDPDSRYLYSLTLLHTDGHELALYEIYEERQALNLAKEISTFVRRPIRWL